MCSSNNKPKNYYLRVDGELTHVAPDVEQLKSAIQHITAQGYAVTITADK